MKINDNKEIFMEVRFGDLKPGDTFAIELEAGYIYCIRTKTEYVDYLAFDLNNGSAIWLKPHDLVIPIEIIGDVKWPDKFFRRK